MKRLKKSNNKVICGVCGGLAEYIGLDATVVRLIVCILSLLWGTGLFIYIIAALIMPSPDSLDPENDNVDNLKSANFESEPKKEGSDVPHSNEEFDSYFKKQE